MSNSAMPNLPGFGNITDTMEFVRTMWGGGKTGGTVPGIGIPGMVMPTLSVEEVNKQIADLKAVESWLNLNMNMLRGTIQALEVQSATTSALKTMGEAFGNSVKTATAGVETANADRPTALWPSASATRTDSDELERLRQNDLPDADDATDTEKAIPGSPSVDDDVSGSEKIPDEQPSVSLSIPAATTPIANPAIWWNLLQDQFKQAVGNAMAGESPAPVKNQKRETHTSDSAGGNDAGSKQTQAKTATSSSKPSTTENPAAKSGIARKTAATRSASQPAQKANSRSDSKSGNTAVGKKTAGKRIAKPSGN